MLHDFAKIADGLVSVDEEYQVEFAQLQTSRSGANHHNSGDSRGEIQINDGEHQVATRQ
jgi:hypothetical protein